MPVFSVFRKETYTGLLPNFQSLCPMSWKRSIILCLLHRAYNICSSSELFHLEVGTLRNIFARNGYPTAFFNKVLGNFLRSKTQTDTSPRPNSNTEVDPYTIVLPYFGYVSDNMKYRLLRLGRKYNLNLRIAFRSFKVGCYFSLKSLVPKPLRSCVVYKFTCSADPTYTYIGKTQRHLLTRVSEHSTASSAISQHVSSCTCQAIVNNFEVLRTCNSGYDLSICEALYIKDENPSLNSALANNGQSLYLKLQ